MKVLCGAHFAAHHGRALLRNRQLYRQRLSLHVYHLTLARTDSTFISSKLRRAAHLGKVGYSHSFLVGRVWEAGMETEGNLANLVDK